MGYQCASNVPLNIDQIAITISHGLIGCHLGIAFYPGNNSPTLAHLAFHRKFSVDSYPPMLSNWASSVVALPPTTGGQLTAMLQGLVSRYKFGGSVKSKAANIAYGINIFAGQGAITLDGRYSPGKDCDGFTCSTIVAETFRLFGFDLVDLRTWDEKPVNKIWGDAVICMLQADGAEAAHVAAVKRNNKGLRLRPEEVAAAGEKFAPGLPLAYADVDDRAAEIVQEMTAACGAPPPAHQKMKNCADAYYAGVAALAPAPVVAAIAAPAHPDSTSGVPEPALPGAIGSSAGALQTPA